MKDGVDAFACRSYVADPPDVTDDALHPWVASKRGKIERADLESIDPNVLGDLSLLD